MRRQPVAGSRGRGPAALLAGSLLTLAFLFPSAVAGEAVPQASVAPEARPATRSGREIYARFQQGLADKECAVDTSSRWSAHFANAPRQLAAANDDVLPLFGYVVDALREADLPTEYALIPFVESGYKPGARSAGGPAGLWQMIGLTARNHGVTIRPGYDGRLSPVDSTRAAVRYLKTLHGMFAGDWRLAVMAYNAGEYRIFGALKRSGQRANAARPAELAGLSGITQAYVRKLHALACLFDQAGEREEWMRALDRQVPVLAAVPLQPGNASLDAWAGRRNLDPGLVRRLNPAFAGGRIAAADHARPVLAPGHVLAADAAGGRDETPMPVPDAARAQTRTLGLAAPEEAGNEPLPRSHTVASGESAWTIARRHGLSSERLLELNGLGPRSVLRPGMVLALAAPGMP